MGKSTTRKRGRVGIARLAIAGVIFIIAIVIGAHTLITYLGYPKDMRGNPVILPAPPQAVQDGTDAVASVDGMRLRVPSTGLDVPLGELNEVDGVIDPPGFASAYLVRNYGANLGHASIGTVFVAMHSCRHGGTCPGNYLINVHEGTASVTVGADVYVDGLHYRVTGWQKVHKPDVRTDTAIWANSPGRLVLLTCLQVPAQTEPVENMVVIAQLVTATSAATP